MNKTTDQKIMETIKQDPEQGMILLMETYTGLIFKVISFHLQNPEDIKECTNDTFAEFYFKQSSFDENKSSLPVYLTAIGRNLAISRYRKEKNHTKNISIPDISSNDNSLALVEIQMDLKRALDTLKPNEQEIILMKYYEGMSIAEIAKSLKLPYETVKKRHQRSLIKLRQTLLFSIILLCLALFSASAYAVLRHFHIIPSIFSLEKHQDSDEEATDKRIFSSRN